MTKTIFLPDIEQTGKLLENAWRQFCQEAKNAGYNINDKTGDGFVKDGFVAGYCSGYNDMLNIIRDQFRMMDIERDVFDEN